MKDWAEVRRMSQSVRKKMGLNTAILGKIGDNQFKEIIQKHLKDNGVSTSLCHVEKNYMKISSILLSPQGERTIISL